MKCIHTLQSDGEAPVLIYSMLEANLSQLLLPLMPTLNHPDTQG